MIEKSSRLVWHNRSITTSSKDAPDDGVYLDYLPSDSPGEPIPVSFVLSVENVYNFDPVPLELTTEEAQHVLGGQANIWTEHMDSPRTVDFFAFPRLCAVSEALSGGPERNFTDFSGRLEHHLARLDAIGVEYHRAGGPPANPAGCARASAHPRGTSRAHRGDDSQHPLTSSRTRTARTWVASGPCLSWIPIGWRRRCRPSVTPRFTAIDKGCRSFGNLESP